MGNVSFTVSFSDDCTEAGGVSRSTSLGELINGYSQSTLSLNKHTTQDIH